jgi:polyvinyl alcohol dehydrogenase (cytochrome)
MFVQDAAAQSVAPCCHVAMLGRHRTRDRIRRRNVAGVCAAIAVCTSLSGIATADAIAASRATGSNRKDWRVYGHDLSNTRLNAKERKINRTTVARLTKSWSIDSLVGVSGTPTVWKRVAYFGDWTGTVRAVRAATGEQLWSTRIGGFIVGAPAIKGDAIYASSGTTLYRLDRKTGAVRWSASTNEHPTSQINASPVVVDGLVLQGVANIEAAVPVPVHTVRGSIGAYDAKTGKEVWRFYTTPLDATSGAGIGIWSTPAVDRKLGLLYVGTGQNTSEPTGPLADSLLAIEYKTGKLRWSRQFTNPDVFPPSGRDADVGASPNLWTSNGVPLVGAGDKAGVFHALNRVTGEVVWETRLTPGGYFGGVIGSAAFVDGALIAVSNIGNARVPASKAVALDPASGALRWTSDFEGSIFAPVGAVSGVAFVGTSTGVLAALDTRTGARLWTYVAPDKTGCGPSIVDGRVLWGYGFAFFGAVGQGGVVSFTVDDNQRRR